MIHLLMSLGLALVAALVLKLLIPAWWLCTLLGLLAGGGLFFWLSRRAQSQLEAIFQRAGELLKKQQFDAALAVMKEAYALAPRQFLVKGTVDGQIGMVQYVRKKHEEAEPLLKSASMQHYIAKAMLAILQWRRGEVKEARKTFELALKSGRKESLLYAVYAFVLNEMKERDHAIEILNKGLAVCKGDERLLNNRNLLQNKKPMKMKVYGEQWYQFLLERPVLRQELPPFVRISKRALKG
ncbi:MAG: hypothetical protein HY823_02595 [Acidobacteria bacterium]|nr:hypothetical protein [Acidobacteriota bacterium]